MTEEELRVLESTLTFTEILMYATTPSFSQLPGTVGKWKALYHDRELLRKVLSVAPTPEEEQLFVCALADAWRKGVIVESATYPRRARRALGRLLAVRFDTPDRAYEALHALSVVEKTCQQKREHRDAGLRRLRERFSYTQYLVPDTDVDLNAYNGYAFTKLYPPIRAMGAALVSMWFAHFVEPAVLLPRRRRRRRRRGNGHRTRNYARRR